jgi:hypothetical protein
LIFGGVTKGAIIAARFLERGLSALVTSGCAPALVVVLNKCDGFQGTCDYVTRLSARASIAFLKRAEGDIPIAFRFELG